MVRIPPVHDIATAIEVYYSCIELRNSDIYKLFGRLGSSKVVKLKNLARDKMLESNTPIWDAQAVNTKAAYEAWGLDIADLEKRHKKLCELERSRTQ